MFCLGYSETHSISSGKDAVGKHCFTRMLFGTISDNLSNQLEDFAVVLQLVLTQGHVVDQLRLTRTQLSRQGKPLQRLLVLALLDQQQ